MSLEKKADSLDQYVEAYETGDYSAALSAFRSAALDGNPKAQYYLGLMYRDGKGVIRSRTQAEALLEKSAASGYEPAGAAFSAIRQSSNLFKWKSKSVRSPGLSIAAARKNPLRPGVGVKPLFWSDEESSSFAREYATLVKLNLAGGSSEEGSGIPDMQEADDRRVAWVVNGNSNTRDLNFLRSLSEKGSAKAMYYLGMTLIFSDFIDHAA